MHIKFCTKFINFLFFLLIGISVLGAVSAYTNLLGSSSNQMIIALDLSIIIIIFLVHTFSKKSARFNKLLFFWNGARKHVLSRT